VSVVTLAKRKLAARVVALVERLRVAHPEAKCALRHENPLQLLVSTILSAQCTDVRVNLVTPALFARYPDAAAFAKAQPAELERMIRSTGFFRNKARSILGCCRALVEQYHGEVPRSMADLIQLPGIGRKTANVVLGVAFGHAEGIVVDTHVLRLSRRLGLTKATTPEKVEAELVQIVARPDWIEFSHLLIWHGRQRCTARRPDCEHCEVASVCPRIGVPKSHP
jgi:endonuclease-3